MGRGLPGCCSALWLLALVLVAADDDTAMTRPTTSNIMVRSTVLATTVDLMSTTGHHEEDLQNVTASVPYQSLQLPTESANISSNISGKLHSTPQPTPFRLPYVPHYHHQGSRWGPFFEDSGEPMNVTARMGSTVRLDCKVGMLHDKTVTWVHRKSDSIRLLTVGKVEYSSDERIRLSFRYPSNWRLELLYVNRRDEGLYECQVAIHPPLVKRVYLKVTAPKVVIMDENSHEVLERYYKAGSAVELICLATQVEEPGDYVIWRHGDAVLNKGVSVNSSVGPDKLISTLTLDHAQRRHSGNYTCVVGNSASATVAVHILNGELPAAVQHGNGAQPKGWHLLWLLLPLVLHR